MAVNAYSPARETTVAVRFVTAAGVEEHHEAEIPELLARDGGFLWVDVPVCDAEAAALLSDVFHFHPLGVRACQERVALPKIHAYADHFFIVLHGVEPAGGGRLHTLELSMFLSQRYMVTVHGRPDEDAPGDLVERETAAV